MPTRRGSGEADHRAGIAQGIAEIDAAILSGASYPGDFNAFEAVLFAWPSEIYIEFYRSE
jgi:hypothetical protein